VIQIFDIDYRLRSYDWGSTHWIHDLFAVPNPENAPQAELWFGAHESAPSCVHVSGRRLDLDSWIADDPVTRLGAGVAADFDGRLPFLLKVLAAASPLSIQAHPNAEQAKAGFERENARGIAIDADERSYRDAHPKPELLCALTRFDALLGFRAPGEIAELLEPLKLGELATARAGLTEAGDGERAALRGFVACVMQMDPSLQQELSRRAAERSAEISHSVNRATPYLWVCELAESHPGDIGVLAPLLLNIVTLEPGEAIFLPAGEMHSYLRGCGVELMANSDNVLRGGLTGKFKDIPELLNILSYRSGSPEILRPDRVSSLEAIYRTPAREFELSVLDLAPGKMLRCEVTTGAEILLCSDGELLLTPDSGRSPLRLSRGSAAFVSSSPGSYQVSGDGRAFRAGIANG
jgi:mannose-6-phosphate isomerase